MPFVLYYFIIFTRYFHVLNGTTTSDKTQKVIIKYSDIKNDKSFVFFFPEQTFEIGIPRTKCLEISNK